MTHGMTYLLLIVLAIAMGVFVAWPLLRRAPQEQGGEDSKALTRARLLEVEQDLTAGIVDGEAADSQRKLIIGAHLDAQQAGAAAAGPATGTRRLAGFFVAAASIPVLAFSLYVGVLGTPGMQDRPLAARLAQDPQTMRADELVGIIERRLYDNPDDVAGWRVLAPAYLRMGRGDDAVRAYTRILALAGATATHQEDLAAALVMRDEGLVSSQARQLFEAALAQDSTAARPRFFIALAHTQANAHEIAARHWRDLIALGEKQTPSPPWLAAARNHLRAVEQALGVRETEKEAPSPRLNVSPEQMQQIQGMVSGLAARLAEDADDLPGWLRLIRSYKVLGSVDKANQAIAAARQQFDDDPQALRQIAQLIKALALEK